MLLALRILLDILMNIGKSMYGTRYGTTSFKIVCVCVFKQAYKMMFPVMSDCPPSQAITMLRISAIPHLLEGR